MDKSPFARLFAELRNKIYEFVLVQQEEIDITASSYNHKLRTSTALALMKPLAITAACRQMRAESSQLFYAANTFHICFPKGVKFYQRDEICLLQRFRAELDTVNGAALRKIRVTVARPHAQSVVCGELDDNDEEVIVTDLGLQLNRQLRGLGQFAAAHPTCSIECHLWYSKTGIWGGPDLAVPLLHLDFQHEWNTIQAGIVQLEDIIKNNPPSHLFGMENTSAWVLLSVLKIIRHRTLQR